MLYSMSDNSGQWHYNESILWMLNYRSIWLMENSLIKTLKICLKWFLCFAISYTCIVLWIILCGMIFLLCITLPSRLPFFFFFFCRIDRTALFFRRLQQISCMRKMAKEERAIQNQPKSIYCLRLKHIPSMHRTEYNTIKSPSLNFHWPFFSALSHLLRFISSFELITLTKLYVLSNNIDQ